MPETTGLGASSDPTWERLEEQIAWYDRKSISAQRIYKRTKLVEIVAAGIIPLLAAINRPHIRFVTAALGVLVTVLEGLLQLNQYQVLWNTYRSTCEALKHEKFTYLAKAGAYTTAENPHVLLAERIESLVSQEHAQWSALQQQGQKPANAGRS